ncbi:MazG nucleotide pyrophosphohydrolase domain-containing protein [Vibrio parahaemolyticus]|nr:MazG nucleotide pyrophosphohydrolase domain-containing protein [Vibrio parahaemolyticus]
MSHPIEQLEQIMAKLRDPESGCPWDLKQTFDTIVPHTIEETYEVVDAIQNRDWSNLKEELGDLLVPGDFLQSISERARAVRIFGCGRNSERKTDSSPSACFFGC